MLLSRRTGFHFLAIVHRNRRRRVSSSTAKRGSSCAMGNRFAMCRERCITSAYHPFTGPTECRKWKPQDSMLLTRSTNIIFSWHSSSWHFIISIIFPMKFLQFIWYYCLSYILFVPLAIGNVHTFFPFSDSQNEPDLAKFCQLKNFNIKIYSSQSHIFKTWIPPKLLSLYSILTV